MNYKTIIVDDEDKALDRMEKLCRRSVAIDVVGVFTKPSEAIEYVHKNEVDLALLDIEMPLMSGLELAETIQELQQRIDVVFITAFDKYALDAFQVNAVGYLLKPIDFDDLEQQISKLNRKRILSNNPYNRRNMRVQCMGGFYFYKDRDFQEKIKWRTSKAEELLALLIHNRGQAITKDRIIDTLWPEMDYDKASKNLHAISYYIRDALQELGYEDIFIRSKGQYRLKVERLEIDVIALEYMMQYSPLKAIPDNRIMNIMKLGKGRYFENKDYSWAVATGIWLKNRLDEIAMIKVERLINEKDYDVAIGLLMDIIKGDRCNELAFKNIIETNIKGGNLNAAKQWYHTYQVNMREELDAEPDEQIKALFKSIH